MTKVCYFELDLLKENSICKFKEKLGKCVIKLTDAYLCSNCQTIHLNKNICPNCYSKEQHKLIEKIYKI